jgi:hypothetical protein
MAQSTEIVGVLFVGVRSSHFLKGTRHTSRISRFCLTSILGVQVTTGDEALEAVQNGTRGVAEFGSRRGR